MRQPVKDEEIIQILERVRLIRAEKGISIIELVKRTGISSSHIHYLETKQVSPSVKTLLTLAKGLEVSVKDFFE